MQMIRGHWQLIALVVLVFLLWDTPLSFPLKILVVFLHEISHGLAAVFTGGSIELITVNALEGGTATNRGGNLFLILSAGYVGSLLIGVLLLVIALRTHADRLVMALLGLLVLGVTLLFVRDLFAALFGLLTGVLMLATARYLNRPVNDLLLRLIGLTSMIYVPYDIFSDTLQRSQLASDAYMLAEAFGGTTRLWGGLWLGLSLAVIGLCLRYGLGRASNIPFRRQSSD